MNYVRQVCRSDVTGNFQLRFLVNVLYYINQLFLLYIFNYLLLLNFFVHYLLQTDYITDAPLASGNFGPILVLLEEVEGVGHLQLCTKDP